MDSEFVIENGVLKKYNGRGPNVTIPSGITAIERSAFIQNPFITSVSIPNGVTRIGTEAFCCCYSLQNVEIPNTVTEIETRAFAGCVSLIILPIPDSVEKIGGEAFEGCKNLRGISLPGNLKTISLGTFADCSNLRNIFIPSGVEEIKDQAFWGCTGLRGLLVNDDNSVFHSNGNCIIESATGKLVVGCLHSIIPDDGSIKSIGRGAFAGLGIGDIRIPNGVVSIGYNAFCQCYSLDTIVIPKSVTTIAEQAFMDCESLIRIIFKGTMEEWEEIEKEDDWDDGTANYTVHCTDGEVPKSES